MKKLILSTLLFISVSAIFAQSPRYNDAMKKNLQALDSAKTTQDLNNVSAAFARIGDAEKTLWQPYYYAALTQLHIDISDPKADKDVVGQKVDTLLAKAEAIQKNSELSALHYYNEVMKMSVDPAQRYMAAAAKMQQYYDDAVAQDSTNPRIYFLKGETVFHTPESFGGGKDVAKPIFQKALDLSNLQKPSTDFSPRWGKEQSEEMLKECDN